ncbi:MAG: hypothetical protein JWN14_328 [Chthonomonadales bacterium]|nr:hypothetical protein [Chthonomonadales bacterium]
MKRGLQGYLLPQVMPGESFRAFVPHPLPPKPDLEFNTELNDLLEQANRAIGRLDGISLLLPNIALFLYFYIRKEAVLSSQIEGTQSSLSDLLLFESHEVPGVPLDDVREVSNYVAAMTFGMEQIRTDNPLSLRLIKEMHSVLLSRGRGRDQRPGEFRQSQNWIHGTRPGNALFVPAPWNEVQNLMQALANFIHDVPERTPTLIKAALAHVQFETIHPFLDGNGRLGRLLITLILCHENALREPLLYLSLYFKTHRTEYYDLLQKVRTDGDWEEWLRFFMKGVQVTADQAATAAQQIVQLFDRDREIIQNLGRISSSALRVHHLLQKKPLLTIAEATSELGLSKPTIASCLAALVKLDIVAQQGGQTRRRVYVYDQYLKILSEGTELP